jgi:enoyl-CoA hydratase/carnithine racemase
MFKTLNWKLSEGIGFLELRQPPSNRMDRIFFDELHDLTTRVIPSEMPAALIIYGSGRHFSSGADIDDLLRGVADSPEMAENKGVPDFLIHNNKSFLFFYELKIPVIAAIQGVCLGSALELALFCHFRICSDNALLALPELSFNLMPGCGGTQTLPAVCGRSTALQLMLEGRSMDASEALELGITDRVVARKELLSSAIALAKQLITDYHPDKRPYYLKKYLAYHELQGE